MSLKLESFLEMIESIGPSNNLIAEKAKFFNNTKYIYYYECERFSNHYIFICNIFIMQELSFSCFNETLFIPSLGKCCHLPHFTVCVTVFSPTVIPSS